MLFENEPVDWMDSVHDNHLLIAKLYQQTCVIVGLHYSEMPNRNLGKATGSE